MKSLSNFWWLSLRHYFLRFYFLVCYICSCLSHQCNGRPDRTSWGRRGIFKSLASVHDGWKDKAVGMAEEWPISDTMNVRWASSFLTGQPARREQDQKQGWLITTKEPTLVRSFCQPGPLTLNILYLLHTVTPAVWTHEPVGNILHPNPDIQCHNHHVYITWLHPHMTFLFCFLISLTPTQCGWALSF